MPHTPRHLLAAMLAVAMHCSFAADSAPVPGVDPLAGVRVHIANQQWTAAVEALKRLNDVSNADWNNLMGYSLRKGATPDYAAAERFYDRALLIDPKHRGALEYSGELYLMTGNLPKAEQRLAALDKACTLSCAEYRTLKRAIERYKAADNKYVSDY